MKVVRPSFFSYLEKMRFLPIVLLLTSLLAYGAQGANEVNSYFELWLKAHKFEDFEKKPDGIHFRKNGATISGDIYGVNELQAGKFYSVETRIALNLGNGKTLEDFVAGAGTTPQLAFEDSLQNFCLTTLHPIYAELFDHNDPHVRKASWSVGGKTRRVFLSEWGQRGELLASPVQKDIESIIESKLKTLGVSGEIHWVKLVVANIKGKTDTLVFTIDGVQNDAINKNLRDYAWPKSKEFYASKLFFVIGKT
jgi:hypothetical protein